MIASRMTYRRIAQLQQRLTWAIRTQHEHWRQREIAMAAGDVVAMRLADKRFRGCVRIEIRCDERIESFNKQLAAY